MFDDGFSSVYKNAFPLLESFGFPANVATIGSTINKSGFLTERQLKELLDKGWSLSDHSYTHKNFKNLDPKTIEREITKNKNVIHDLLNYEFLDFVFPKSKVSNLSLRLVLDYYKFAFTGSRRLSGNIFPFNQRLLMRTEISTYEILTTYKLRSSFFLKTLQEYLINLSRENRQEWLILFTHRVVDKPSLFDTSKEVFSKVLEAIRGAEITVKTTSEVVRSFS
jgi:peptidoglycan/xylan/chitin deacetylase (PgdA/CDA1 family)